MLRFRFLLCVKVFVSVIGDILGAAVLNVDELIEMPMGCGEQNVARLFPNVLIYDYLSRFKSGLTRLPVQKYSVERIVKLRLSEVR